MIIETHNLTKEYNGIKALKGVSFSVKEGEIFGFLAPNGAGKTTTTNMLTTLLKSISGYVEVAGYDYTIGIYDWLIIKNTSLPELIKVSRRGVIPTHLSLENATVPLFHRIFLSIIKINWSYNNVYRY
ncbi:daunorubicin/doxorubicin resistance ATP-binding protein DrrA [archaeon BMS3Bbin15]|nr:daunorubicin/doxorubicin resistance ATP-binding protein DrrA [archaeon BMS3Bbin15]